jgi:hypothetical protein
MNDKIAIFFSFHAITFINGRNGKEAITSHVLDEHTIEGIARALQVEEEDIRVAITWYSKFVLPDRSKREDDYEKCA